MNFVVVDIVGRDKSDFVADLNEYYIQLPEKLGRGKNKRHMQRDFFEGALKRWQTYVRIEIDEHLHIQCFLVPLAPDINNTEYKEIQKNLIEGTRGYIFVVPNEESTWDEATQIIQRFQDYAPVPFVLLILDQHLKEIDINYLRETLDVGDDIEVFAYRHPLKSDVEGVLLGLCYQILDELESRISQMPKDD